MTRIVIAHRPETIRSADRVITLEKGRVVSDVNQRPVADVTELPFPRR
jgi:ATP-binding cassette subfamily B protein RaxB